MESSLRSYTLVVAPHPEKMPYDQMLATGHADFADPPLTPAGLLEWQNTVSDLLRPLYPHLPIAIISSEMGRCCQMVRGTAEWYWGHYWAGGPYTQTSPALTCPDNDDVNGQRYGRPPTYANIHLQGVKMALQYVTPFAIQTVLSDRPWLDTPNKWVLWTAHSVQARAMALLAEHGFQYVADDARIKAVGDKVRPFARYQVEGTTIRAIPTEF